jgi:hypothetical protein
MRITEIERIFHIWMRPHPNACSSLGVGALMHPARHQSDRIFIIEFMRWMYA